MSDTVQRPHDEEPLHALVSNLQEAWNRGDAAAWADQFEEGARFINVRGDVFVGREAIAQGHARIFDGFYKGSRNHIVVQSITFLSPDVALMEVMHHVSNYAFMPPGIAPTEPGLLKALMRFVVARQGGVWTFIAAQNTSLPPAAPMPPMAQEAASAQR